MKKKFNSAISAWRRQSNNLLVEVSDSDSVHTIREQRDLFQTCLDTVCSIFEHLQSLNDDVKLEAAKVENIEIEHQQIIKNVTQHIRETVSIKYEIGSNVSSKSFQSAISKSQSSSSKRSESSKISNVAAKKAVLKAKLKYIDLESKCLADLQKSKQ